MTGLLKGFSTQKEALFAGFMNKPLKDKGDQGGKDTLTNIFDWLKRQPDDKPFFLFANFLEAHLPYDPPTQYRQKHLNDLQTDRSISVKWGHEYNAGLHSTSRVDWDTVKRLYGGDVNTADKLLEGLIKILKQEDLYENTILVVTSDHGENLGDHGMLAHMYSIHETLLSVPLIIHAPQHLAKEVRNNPVMLTDIFATILDLAKVEYAETPRESRSLLKSPKTPQRPLFAEYAPPDSSLVDMLKKMNPSLDTKRLLRGFQTVRLGDLRLTVSDDGSFELHNLAENPKQDLNIADKLPEEVKTLRSLINHVLGKIGAARSEKIEIDEEDRKKIRAIGYPP